MVSDLATVFADARAAGRAALIGYLPVGFPDLPTSIEAMRIMVAAGVDIVEVGIPYSDPVIDGIAIQRATTQALAGGTRVRDTFEAIHAVAETGTPALAMAYWNLVEHYGVKRFAADLAAAGGAGLITPDLLPEEADEWIGASDEHQLARVFLIAPSSPPERIAAATAVCRGFVYAVSVMGVTGAREQASTAAPALVDAARKVSSLPIGVGLGVSNKEQAAQVATYADGVIVGSALVQCFLRNDDRVAALSALEKLVGELAEGVRLGAKK